MSLICMAICMPGMTAIKSNKLPENKRFSKAINGNILPKKEKDFTLSCIITDGDQMIFYSISHGS